MRARCGFPSARRWFRLSRKVHILCALPHGAGFALHGYWRMYLIDINRDGIVTSQEMRLHVGQTNGALAAAVSREPR
jgi:hypothetical protein